MTFKQRFREAREEAASRDSVFPAKRVLIVVDRTRVSKSAAQAISFPGMMCFILFVEDPPEPVKVWDIDKLEPLEMEQLLEAIKAAEAKS